MRILQVLVATDLSEQSDEAIRQAHLWALEANAKLTACIVVPSPMLRPLFPQVAVEESAHLDGIVAGAGKAVWERVVALTDRREGDFTVRVERGTPYAEILRLAEREQADLLVVGSRGESGIRRLLLGSTAEKIVRSAHCSVLVARASPQSKLVVSATDLSDPSFPAIVAGADYARRRGGALKVLHTFQADFILPTATAVHALPIPTLELRAHALEVATSGLRRALAEAQVAAEPLVEEGRAAPTIVGASERLDAELIVVGTLGRTGIARLALGSVAEEVVRAAHCSTLVVRLNVTSERIGGPSQ